MARAGPVPFLSFFQTFAISEIMSSPNAAESSSTKAEKETEFKGQSRVLKKCHWCAKKQDPGEEPFKACGQCKEVIYCSRECQRASWPFHKTGCQINREQRSAVNAADPAAAEDVKTFKKWHTLHIELFKHALVCALDLGKDPKNLDNGYMYIEVKRKDNHAELPMKRKFELVGGFLFTPEEAYEMLGAQGRTILDGTKRQSEYMKKKGGIGMAPIIMQYGSVVDIVNFILPKPDGAALMQRTNNWGKNWVMSLAGALQHA